MFLHSHKMKAFVLTSNPKQFVRSPSPPPAIDSLAYRLLHVAPVLAAVRDGQGLDELLPQLSHYPPEVRAALHDISHTALRWRGTTDFILRQLCQRAPDPLIYGLLDAALALLLAERYEPHTLVDQTVQAARHTQEHSKGFVNGVLRNFLRQQPALLAAAQQDLEARYNHPVWWVEKLQRTYPAHWETILQTAQAHPPLTLRVNQRHLTPADYLARLTEAGLHGRLVGEQAVQVTPPVPVTQLPGFAEGWVSVQDAGAQWAAPLLDVQPGQRVLDACAAPGGKTGHLLEAVDCEVLALDVAEKRLQRVRDNLQRLGLSAQIQVGNALQADLWWDGQPFDRILADVPCSAAGISARHPDIRWRRFPQDLRSLQRQQLQMLHVLWPLLKAGGKLLYATCSIFPEEGEQVITQFLKVTATASCLPVSVGFAGQLLPGIAQGTTGDHDGFFYALLLKS